MTFIVDYWWLIVLPIALVLWIWSLRRTPRPYWIWILRISGVICLSAAATWIVTGDVENQYVSLHMTRGWYDVVAFVTIGIVALVGAHLLKVKQGPPA